ncbi:dual specificity protein phosphatase, putative [Pediculus humanus corporis]|uniref:Dual specificity protein phosphatase 15 n=1 Tax=Pediculus humanus subsp. corporis TaxID=121224 RepID=E0VL47_PEDHC|nr:dual specificity protein phosphatase, putative [Pediculus humanus corporis]EEB14103.1 dual specificity protein phosphatase, putative [Pediculus humanus corporis]
MLEISPALFSGLCASLGSTFGKLSGFDYDSVDVKLKYLLKITFFCLMLLFNSMVWTFFIKALHKSRTSVEATAVNTASNYVFSGLLGYLIFQENIGFFCNNVACRWLRTVFILPIMGNGMNKVLPGLYVGNYRDSKDNAQLERYGITHIIAIHDAARKLHHDKHYLCVMASDTPDQNLSQYFPICNDFIHAARLRGGNVLIHCLAGMSRSVTVTVAYIMSVTDLSWKEALKVVRVGRSVANPNLGFQKQLQEFETCRLGEERKRLKERYPSLALVESDQEQCRLSLMNYESLLQSKDLCEGNCPVGETCPTGLCRSPSYCFAALFIKKNMADNRLIIIINGFVLIFRPLRRKSSSSSLRTSSSPRMLPPTPTPMGGPDLTRSSASINSFSPIPGRRPCSGPAGLHSYTGPSPMQTRSPSRTSVTELPPGVSSLSDLHKKRGNSAPGTPLMTPPSSPQRWPRRASTLNKKPIQHAQRSSLN